MQYSPRMCQCDKVSCVHYSRLHWRSGVPSLLPPSAIPSSSSSSLGIHLQRRHFHIAVFVLRTRDKSCTKYQEKVLAKQKLTRRLHFTACCTTGCTTGFTTGSKCKRPLSMRHRPSKATVFPSAVAECQIHCRCPYTSP